MFRKKFDIMKKQKIRLRREQTCQFNPLSYQEKIDLLKGENDCCFLHGMPLFLKPTTKPSI